jgi:hypothetical protein
MTDSQVPPPVDGPDAAADQAAFAQGIPASAPPPAPVAPGGAVLPVASATGELGKIRNTGTCFLLMIVTLGIYGLYWYFATHDEMKRHSGQGLGGLVALLLAIFVGIVMPFLNSNEVGHLYERRGEKPPVTALTGLWALLLGWFFFVGVIVWFVRTNGALNAYWRSLGAH